MKLVSPPRCRTSIRPHSFPCFTSTSSLIRPLSPSSSSISSQSLTNNPNFTLHPNFYTPSECRQLLSAALWKLDRVDSSRRRSRSPQSSPLASESDDSLQDLFQGPYGFEEGHFDSVIHHFRESLVSAFPPSSPLWPDLIPLLNRAYALLPSNPQITGDSPPNDALTHLLHLAPEGEILPHVDNLDASGGVILGICLGAERVLGMTRKAGEEGWEVVLPNGCVYLQSDEVRYVYEHSILPYSADGSRGLRSGHRVSIMIRDAPKGPAMPA